MNIGIDMRSIQTTALHRGIGKYATSLLRALKELDQVNNYYLLLYPHQAEFAGSALPHTENWHFVYLPPTRLRHMKFIRTLTVGNESINIDPYKLDVVLQLDILYPISSNHTPVVSVVYDLIPFLFKNDYQQPVRLRYKTLAGLIIYYKELRASRIFNSSIFAFNKSDEVIAISEHTAADLHNATNIDVQRLSAIPLGTETISSHTKLHKPEKLESDKQFIFYVGGVDPRKRVQLLLEEFALLRKNHDIKLVIAGKEAADLSLPQAREIHTIIKKLGLLKDVYILGYTSDSELAYLYKHASTFVFPSQYEGFGLPILEAFQAGCPVVAFANSSIPEVAGDAALLVDEGASLASAVSKLLTNRALRDKLVAKGTKRAKVFTWRRTAQETLRVLERVGKNENRH